MRVAGSGASGQAIWREHSATIQFNFRFWDSGEHNTEFFLDHHIAYELEQNDAYLTTDTGKWKKLFNIRTQCRVSNVPPDPVERNCRVFA